MEDLLIALLQGGFEIIAVVFNIIGQLLWDGLGYYWFGDLVDVICRTLALLYGSFTDSWPGMSDNTRSGWIGLLYLIVGLATGAASLHVHHDVFLRRSATRLLALALSPLLSGYVSWLNAKLGIFFRIATRPAYCFCWLFAFDLGLCLVRFGFCHRPIA